MEIELVDKFMSISWTMGQLEIANVESFLSENEIQIRKILEEVHNLKGRTNALESRKEMVKIMRDRYKVIKV